MNKLNTLVYLLYTIITTANICFSYPIILASNHYGIAGMYALQAINEGFIGMSFTNTSPFMVPTRAKEVWKFSCKLFHPKFRFIFT